MVADVPWGQDKGPEARFWIRCWASSHLCRHILVTMFIMLYVQSYFSILVCWYAVDTGIHKFDLVLCEFIVILVDSTVPVCVHVCILAHPYTVIDLQLYYTSEYSLLTAPYAHIHKRGSRCK